MESVRSLDYLRNGSGPQGHGGIGEHGPIDRLGGHAELSSPPGAARILGIHACERGELLTVKNAFAQGEKTFLHSNSRRLAVRVEAYLAHLILDRDYRKPVDIDGVEVLLDVVRSHLRNGLGYVGLLLLGKAHVLELLAPFFAQPVEGLAEILLKALVPSGIGAVLVNAAGKLVFDHVAADGKRVDARLHQEQF